MTVLYCDCPSTPIYSSEHVDMNETKISFHSFGSPPPRDLEALPDLSLLFSEEGATSTMSPSYQRNFQTQGPHHQDTCPCLSCITAVSWLCLVFEPHNTTYSSSFSMFDVVSFGSLFIPFQDRKLWLNDATCWDCEAAESWLSGHAKLCRKFQASMCYTVRRCL